MKQVGTYYYAVFALELIKAGRVGLALIISTTLLVGVIEDIDLVVINVFADKNIGDKFQD